ncbi:MAG: alkaline phosphatase, partial [Zoogloeaceae bacterium]|nr:alkaline phosphatase [Zoogloeaceae bacterium]
MMQLPMKSPARRHFLQTMSAIPMLPVVGSSVAFLATMPAQAALSGKGRVNVEFVPMTAPDLSNAADMATTTVRSQLEIVPGTGEKQVHNLVYHAFFNTGDRVPDGNGGQILAGGYYDIQRRPIVDASIPGKERHFYSDSP